MPGIACQNISAENSGMPPDKKIGKDYLHIVLQSLFSIVLECLPGSISSCFSKGFQANAHIFHSVEKVVKLAIARRNLGNDERIDDYRPGSCSLGQGIERPIPPNRVVREYINKYI